MSDYLTAAVVAAAHHIPEASLVIGANAISGDERWSVAAASRLLEAVPSAVYTTHVRQIAEAWAALPALPGAAVAAAMRAAGAAASEARRENRMSLVWTGPPTDEIALRSTRAVLHDLITGATETLILVSYASYGVTELAEDLREAAERGVHITLILESDEDSQPRPRRRGNSDIVAHLSLRAFCPAAGLAVWEREKTAKSGIVTCRETSFEHFR